MSINELCMGCMGDRRGQDECPECGWLAGTLPDSEHHLTPGVILMEKFLIGRVLGQGGFGVTYMARDINLQVKLAIKEYLPVGLATRSSGQSRVSSYTSGLEDQFQYGLERFLEEARNLAQFENHPNIVTVRDYFRANGTAYMVMSYIEGLTLKDYLQRTVDGTLSFERAVDIMMPVMDALREVHGRNLLHRDISPDNIYIDHNGRVILIDFGAARQYAKEKSSSLSIILKPGYAPEEQYRSKGKQGPWSDVYAVAATFFHLITGQVPPDALDRLEEDVLIKPSHLAADINVRQEKVLIKAMAVRAGDRYQSIAAFQKAVMQESGFLEEHSQTDNDDDIDEDGAEEDDTGEKPGREGSVSDGSRKDVVYQIDDGNNDSSLTDISKRDDKQGATGKIDRVTDNGKQEPDTNDETGKQKSKIFAAVGLLLVIFVVIGLVSRSGLISDTDSGTETFSISTVGDLPIGERVADKSWTWEFRTGPLKEDGEPYSGKGENKPVVWIIVAKEHYGEGSGVTLLSEELIGKFPFDNSTNIHVYGVNSWENSGKDSTASHGLRPWLNSTGIHRGNGFYNNFSDSFRSALVTVNVPNRDWERGVSGYTEDRVFIPSGTEMGDIKHVATYRIGSIFPYFADKGDRSRVASAGSSVENYWLRSPASYSDSHVRFIDTKGDFYGNGDFANINTYAVRPVVCIAPETRVGESPGEDGVYEIIPGR